MLRQGRFITVYRLTWLALVAVFCFAVWLLLYVMPASPKFSEVRLAQMKLIGQDPSLTPEQSIEEQAGPLQLEATGWELSLSNHEGDLLMRIWARKAVKEGDRFSIDEGALQFVTEGRNVLLMRVTDATYQREKDVARVSGTLVGEVTGTYQYFSATELAWDQGTNVVTTSSVRYVGPRIEVRGEEMSVDLRTGNVSFAGPVEAGV